MSPQKAPPVVVDQRGPGIAPRAAPHPLGSDQAALAQVSAHWAKTLEGIFQEIFDHEEFAEFQDRPPLTAAEGAGIAPFSQTEFARVIRQQEKDNKVLRSYTGGGILTLHDLRSPAIPGSSVNVAGIKALRDEFYQTAPARLNFSIHVAVPPGFEMTAHIPPQLLQRLSPEEPIFAAMWGCSEHIKRGATKEQVRDWVRCFRSVTYVFEVMDCSSTSIAQRSSDLRSETAYVGEAVQRTPLGVVVEVISIRQMLERKGNGKVIISLSDLVYHHWGHRSISLSPSSLSSSSFCLPACRSVCQYIRTCP